MNQKKPLIADDDIPCYLFAYYGYPENEVLKNETPYVIQKVPSLIGSEMVMYEIKFDKHVQHYYAHNWNGLIVSHQKIVDGMFTTSLYLCSPHYVVIKCHIPKGVIYFEGLYGCCASQVLQLSHILSKKKRKKIYDNIERKKVVSRECFDDKWERKEKYDGVKDLPTYLDL